MKKLLLSVVLITVVFSAAGSQGLYLDAGLGFGFPFTKIDGENASSYFDSTVSNFGMEIGLKAGYGPIANIPLYLAGTLSFMDHTLSAGSDELNFFSCIFGAGAIFYPIPLVQLAASVGYSYVLNDSTFISNMYDGDGFAFDFSAAVDLGRGKHGILLGARYTASFNVLDVSKAKQNQSLISIFARYAFRRKISR